ncbi:MAG: YraN family protein [Desulfobacterales bacterium]|nr:MAG: YraN family protein [Desulfobacterales bacterium]
MTALSRDFGRRCEERAAAWLAEQGYEILERNYVTPLGEIDLIARDRDVTVFIEVKARRDTRFGHPKQAVNRRKQEKLRRAGLFYLKSVQKTGCRMRFDVVAMIVPETGAPQMELIRNAF